MRFNWCAVIFVPRSRAYRTINYWNFSWWIFYLSAGWKRARTWLTTHDKTSGMWWWSGRRCQPTIIMNDDDLHAYNIHLLLWIYPIWNGNGDMGSRHSPKIRDNEQTPNGSRLDARREAVIWKIKFFASHQRVVIMWWHFILMVTISEAPKKVSTFD